MSYGGNPVDDGTAAQQRDAVRIRIGGATTDARFTDTEIDFFLTDTTPPQAAVPACRALIAYWSTQCDITMSKTQVSASQRAKAFFEMLLPTLETAAAQGASPVAGGLSIATKQTMYDDTDAVQPWFARDDDQVIGVGASSSTNDARSGG